MVPETHSDVIPGFARACVFCGARHSAQWSKEHVFPRWLLRLTGDESREITVDVFQERRRIRALSFVVRACKECNERASELEASTKACVERLIEQNALLLDREKYVFPEDYIFSSPSTAASIVLGRNANGLTEWKLKNGMSLKEFESNEKDNEA